MGAKINMSIGVLKDRLQDGRTVKEIANEFEVAENTIRSNLKNAGLNIKEFQSANIKSTVYSLHNLIEERKANASIQTEVEKAFEIDFINRKSNKVASANENIKSNEVVKQPFSFNNVFESTVIGLFALFFILISLIYFADCNYTFASYFNSNEHQKLALSYAVPTLEFICILRYVVLSKKMSILQMQLELNEDDTKELWLNKKIATEKGNFEHAKNLMLVCFLLCILAHFFVKFEQIQITEYHVFVMVFKSGIYATRLMSSFIYTVIIGAIYFFSMIVFFKSLEK